MKKKTYLMLFVSKNFLNSNIFMANLVYNIGNNIHRVNILREQ